MKSILAYFEYVIYSSKQKFFQIFPDSGVATHIIHDRKR